MRCRTCLVDLPETEFYVTRHGSRAGQIKRQCKECSRKDYRERWAAGRYRYRRQPSREYSRVYAAAHREERYNKSLKGFGLTRESYDRLLVGQGNGCAICGSVESGYASGKFAVDHKHGSSPVLVRGLLCRGCNMALGKFGDSVEGLMVAVKYLVKARA